MNLSSSKNWKTVKLGDIASKMFSGGTPSSQNKEYYGGDIPWLRTQEVTFNYIYKTDLFITEEGFKNSSAKWVPENSVIIAMYGNSAGRVAYSTIPLTTNQACCNIVVDLEKADSKFLYFSLLKDYIKLENMATGGAQQNLSVGVLKDFEIKIPESVSEQKEIADMLGSLDDKIELLRKENKTLESITQTLFKEWFVDFNFLGSTGKMIDSELGEIPDGWRVGKLQNIIDFIVDNRGKTPTTESTKNGFYPLVEVNSMTNVVDRCINLNVCKKYVSYEDYNSWFRKGHPQKGDVLISTVGSIGETCLVSNEKICIAQNIIALRSSDTGEYLYQLLSQMRDVIVGINISSVQPSIKVPHLLSLEIVIPPKNIIQEYIKIIKPISDKIFSNNYQNQTLSKLRDELLNKIFL